MPNALRIGLLGPLQVRDETGRQVHVGGRQLRVLLTLLALSAGRVVPAGSLAGQIWPDDPDSGVCCLLWGEVVAVRPVAHTVHTGLGIRYL